MKRIREKVMVLLVLAIMFGLMTGCGKSINKTVEAETPAVVEETYVMLGTATERFDCNLVDLAETLDLNPDEVADWLINHDDTNFTSFKAARDTNNEPAFIICY